MTRARDTLREQCRAIIPRQVVSDGFRVPRYESPGTPKCDRDAVPTESRYVDVPKNETDKKHRWVENSSKEFSLSRLRPRDESLKRNSN